MTVYVDDARIPRRSAKMCHMWADSVEELHAMASSIRVDHQNIIASPIDHYMVFLKDQERARMRGAVQLDKFGFAEHVARMNGDAKLLENIAASRARRRS